MKPGPCLPALLLGWAALSAQEQPGDVVHPIQGEPVAGKVIGIDGQGQITLEFGEQRTTLQLGDQKLLELRRGHVAKLPATGFVLLRTGLRLPATVREATERTVTVDSPLTDGKATFALSHVQAIRFVRLEQESDGGFTKYLAAPKDDADLIYFATAGGDKVLQRSVRVLGFAGGELQYEARDQDVHTRKLTELYGIVMAKASGFPPDALPRPRVVLDTEGGTSIRGRLGGLDGTHCTVTLAEQVTLKVLRSRIERMHVESDRLVYLTDLEPVKVEQAPALRKKSPWLKNRTLLGHGLELGGENPRRSTNGLALVPRTSLTYDLGGNFDVFHATIGIDSRSTGPAHAVFRVRAGDKVLFESKPMTIGSEPQPIRIPVQKVEALTIEADFGENFDFGDHCLFAEARVTRSGP